jgi:hypothetical protein
MAKLFEMVGELTEQVKQCVGITNQLSPTVQLVEKLEKKINEDVTKLNNRMLIVEHENKNNKTELKKLVAQLKPISSTYDSVQEAIRKNEERAEKLQNELKERMEATLIFDPSTIHEEAQKILDAGLTKYDEQLTNQLAVMEAGMSAKQRPLITSAIVRDLIAEGTPNITPLIEKISKIENELEVRRNVNPVIKLEERITKLEQATTPPPKTPDNPPENTIQIKRPVFNHDVIIIGDSNTTNIDMGKLGKNTKRRRFTKYTINDAMNFIDTTEVINAPKKVMLHVGTNDIVTANGDTDVVIAEMKELIRSATTKFPTSRIILSSIFNRKDPNDKLNTSIKSINDSLEHICDATPLLTFLNNGNISHKEMTDGKHVDPRGFHIFVSNIRYILFGEPPPMKTR